MTSTISDEVDLSHYRGVLRERYAGQRHFVYPDIGFLSRILARRSAFLDRGQAQPFAVHVDATPAAFAVAFIDPGLQTKVGRPVGSIGFFEAADDQSGAALLDAACAWLAERAITEVWAPFNANPYYRMGTREDRFDEPPFVGCAHDPPATVPMLEAAGFERVNGYRNYEIDLAARPWERAESRPARIGFRPVSRAQFRRDVLAFVNLHNRAFRPVWGEVEISDAEALQLLMRSRFAIEPRLFQFATADDRPVGFVLCVPNLGEALAPLHKPLTSPAGLVRMARRRKQSSSVGLLSLAVAPEHQGESIGTALVARACRAAADLGFARLEYALVAETNEASIRTAHRFDGQQCRSFGIFARQLAT